MQSSAIYEERHAMKYELVKSICKTQGSEGATVYGIRITSMADKDCFSEYDDISPDIMDVKRLLYKLENNGVTYEQLGCIVEDYLYELYSVKL